MCGADLLGFLGDDASTNGEAARNLAGCSNRAQRFTGRCIGPTGSIDLTEISHRMSALGH
jgi:hypothetical protein